MLIVENKRKTTSKEPKKTERAFNRHDLEGYFTSTLQAPVSELSPTSGYAKKTIRENVAPIRTISKEKTDNSSTTQFFTKIKNLLHDSNCKSPRDANFDLFKSQKDFDKEMESTFTKTTLLKSMHSKPDLKKENYKEPKYHDNSRDNLNVYKTLGKEISSDQKRMASCHSESKIVKARTAKTSSGARGNVSTYKVAPKTNMHKTGSVLKIAKTRQNNAVNTHIRTRGHDNNSNSIDQAHELSSYRPETSNVVARVTIKKPNPEYFELKGKTIDSEVKSPSNKNIRNSNLSKLIASINSQGKENENIASGACTQRYYCGSVLKNKGVQLVTSPSQSRIRQTASIMYF